MSAVSLENQWNFHLSFLQLWLLIFIDFFLCRGSLDYRWFREGGKEMPRTATFSETRRVMTIEDVQIEDSGRYRCRVDSRSTSLSDEKNFTLNVQCRYSWRGSAKTHQPPLPLPAFEAATIVNKKIRSLKRGSLKMEVHFTDSEKKWSLKSWGGLITRGISQWRTRAGM